MSKKDQIVDEINKLLAEANPLLTDKALLTDHSRLNIAYESWYTKTYGVVSQLVPERLEDLKSAYKAERRKALTAETYRIFDFLQGTQVHDSYRQELFSSKMVYQARLLNQIAILKSAADSVQSLLRDIRSELRAELFDNDVQAANELLKQGHLRSAGVICGVVLEGHFQTVAERREITLSKKAPTIADYNDAFKDAHVYDIPMWRFVQRLADIRNLCAHKKERDPTHDEVTDLAAGTDRVIKEVF